MRKNIQELMLDVINPEVKVPSEREIIFLAEDADFTMEQSAVISSWLLNFALERKNKNRDYELSLTTSAIRTGASMLYPKDINILLSLLETENIDITLVTAKMVGRIFEAQPPEEIDKYNIMADKIFDIISNSKIFLDPSDTLESKEAALTQLCFIALVAMGSTKVEPFILRIKNKKRWFEEQILHETKRLKTTWEQRKNSTSSQLIEFLDKIIESLES